MKQNALTIFKLNDNPIYFWDDYGAVCPNLFTTNGNIGELSKCVHSYITRSNYKVTDCIFDLDFSTVDLLIKGLIREYRIWQNKNTIIRLRNDSIKYRKKISTLHSACRAEYIADMLEFLDPNGSIKQSDIIIHLMNGFEYDV